MTDLADDTTVITCDKCGVHYVKKNWVEPHAHPCRNSKYLTREFNKFAGWDIVYLEESK